MAKEKGIELGQNSHTHLALEVETASSSETETKLEPRSSPKLHQEILETPPIDPIHKIPYIPPNPPIINHIPIDMGDEAYERTLRQVMETDVTQTNPVSTISFWKEAPNLSQA